MDSKTTSSIANHLACHVPLDHYQDPETSIVALLRELGVYLIVYIDDTLLLAESSGLFTSHILGLHGVPTGTFGVHGEQ